MSIRDHEEPSYVPMGPTHGRRAPSLAARVTVRTIPEALARELSELRDQMAEDEREYGALGRALTACRALRDARTPAEHEAAVALACAVADEARRG